MREWLLLIDKLSPRAVADVLARGRRVHGGLARRSANDVVAVVVIHNILTLLLRPFLVQKNIRTPHPQANRTNTTTAATVAEPPSPLLSFWPLKSPSPLIPWRPTSRPNLDFAAPSCSIRCDESATTETTELHESSLFCWAAINALTSSPVSRPRIGARRRRVAVLLVGAELGM
jgi:hypothetical protein